jgi:hypothetical protein
MKQKGAKGDPTQEQDEHTVFYFKPESFLLDEPEK